MDQSGRWLMFPTMDDRRLVIRNVFRQDKI
jgi:hypothetical protein